MREFLLDVSRLVWRVWRGRLWTGIDRVCLAYVEHFASRSQAVVQRNGLQFVLSPAHSDRLFELLLTGGAASRLDLFGLAAKALPAALMTRPQPGTIYFNVGHTGLNESSLPAWIARHRLRAVYLIHDLIPLTHPQFCRAGEFERHGQRMQNVLASAAGLIGNSQATLNDLAAFAELQGCSMPPSVVAWISGGAFGGDVSPRALPKPYFVIVGTIEGRKNHVLLLEVWRRLIADLRENAPVLVIIGQRGWRAEQIFEQLDRPGDLEHHILELGTCGDDDLAGWIAGARALLIPSFAEGFGLPVIEALQTGTPVIASDLSVFREIAGDLPTYLDPLDEEGWERTIRGFTGDGAERERQLAHMKRFRAPGWNGHFATVECWLESI